MRPEAAKNLKNGVLIPAMPLVLDQNRMFDSKKQKRLVRYYLEAGAGGIAAAVHRRRDFYPSEKKKLCVLFDL